MKTREGLETARVFVRGGPEATQVSGVIKAFVSTTDEEAADDAEWDAIFESKSDVLKRLAKEALTEHAQQKTRRVKL